MRPPAAGTRRTPTLQEIQLELEPTQPFRPLGRPPVAFLCIVDDGPDGGEWVRLRADRVVLGRSEGDVRIPHDVAISGRHAELSRVLHKGNFVWQLTDLQSTNGCYARVNRAVLEPGQEILLGGGHYRFDAPLDRGRRASPDDEAEQITTWRWTGKSENGLVPYLLELGEAGEGSQYELARSSNWIGRDPRRCQVVLPDPMVDPQHARIYREPTGVWHLHDVRSLNGTWVRVEQFRIKQMAQFQVGRQRFVLRLGS